MTKQEAKDRIPILQAFAEGKTIEFLNSKGDWEVASSPTFCLEYRVQPDPPKTYWLALNSKNEIIWLNESKKEVQKYLKVWSLECARIIQLVETPKE